MSDADRNKQTHGQMLAEGCKGLIVGATIVGMVVGGVALAMLVGWLILATTLCFFMEGWGITTMLDCFWSHRLPFRGSCNDG